METTTKTRFGEYLEKRSVNKASVARKTNINTNRLTELSRNPATHLKADELYVIARAINVDPCEMLEFICDGMEKVKKPVTKKKSTKEA